MPELSNTSIASTAKQATDGSGFMTMINMKASLSDRGCLAYGALAFLCLKHLCIRPMCQAVLVLCIIIGVTLKVVFTPAFAGCSMACRVFVAAGRHCRNGTWLAVLLLAVMGSAIRSEVFYRKGILALWTPFHSFWCLPSWMWTVSGLGINYLAPTAITGKAIRSGLGNIKLGGILHYVTFGATFFRKHLSSPGVDLSRHVLSDKLIQYNAVL